MIQSPLAPHGESLEMVCTPVEAKKAELERLWHFFCIPIPENARVFGNSFSLLLRQSALFPVMLERRIQFV